MKASPKITISPTLQLELIDNFFAQNGSKCLLFYYEERPIEGEVITYKLNKRAFI